MAIYEVMGFVGMGFSFCVVLFVQALESGFDLGLFLVLRLRDEGGGLRRC